MTAVAKAYYSVIHIEELLLFDGELEKAKATFLKDDRSNTAVISKGSFS